MSGRRTWVVSVFILGLIILYLLNRRLRPYHILNKQKVFVDDVDRREALPSGRLLPLKGSVGDSMPGGSGNQGGTVDIRKQQGISNQVSQLHNYNSVSKDPPLQNQASFAKDKSLHQKKSVAPNQTPNIPNQRMILPRNPTTNKTHHKDQNQQIIVQNISSPNVQVNPVPSSCTYGNVPAPESWSDEPQKWQNVAKRTIMVFSAYFESREAAGGPLIRVLASGKQTRFGHSGKVSCVLWVKQSTSVIGVPTEASYNVIYESRLHSAMYTAHFILCNLRKVSVSSHTILGVSVVPENCGVRLNVLKVVHRKPLIAKNNTFSVCLSPIYGNYDNAPAIIEHFEMHKILGVEKITVYLLSVGPRVRTILEKYRTEGLVDIVKWDYPFSQVLCDYFAQREALNDCLYRSMGGRTRFLALVDLDEVITPRKTLIWDAMMSRIYKPERGAYLFQHAYFLTTSKKRGSKPTLLTQTVFSRPSVVFPPGKIRCKSIYEMEKTVQVNIHFPYTLLPGFQEYIVPPEEAILHHYRHETMQIFHDGSRNFTYITDTYMVNYANRIRKAFSKRLKQFNIV